MLQEAAMAKLAASEAATFCSHQVMRHYHTIHYWDLQILQILKSLF